MDWVVRAAGSAALVGLVFTVPTIVVGVGGTAGPAGAADTATVSAVSEVDFDHQITVRRSFGLSADPAYVAGVQGAPYGPLGIPMTDAEAAEAARRDELARHLDGLRALLARELPDSFAGAWLDQAAGGVPVVAATAVVPERLRRAVAALLPAGPAADYRVVAVSARRLAALAARVAADEAWFAGVGVGLVGWQVRPAANVVRLELAAGTADAGVERVRQRYGSAGLDVAVEGVTRVGS